MTPGIENLPAPPALPAIDYAALVEDALIEAGAAPDLVERAAGPLAEIVEDASHAEAAGVLRAVLWKLDGTAGGVALRRVLIGSDASLREDAKAAGTSHVALWKAEKRVRGRLGLTPGT